MNVPAAIKKSMGACPAFRISSGDTNYFALVFDREGEDCDLVAVVEIFEPGGRTPPNGHLRAHEMFFVLEGEGRHQSVRLLPDARDPKTTRAIAELMAQPRGLFPLQ